MAQEIFTFETSLANLFISPEDERYFQIYLNPIPNTIVIHSFFPLLFSSSPLLLFSSPLIRDPTALYHKMTIAELQALTPSIPWGTYFGSLGVDTARVMPNLNVAILNFTRGLNDLLVQTDINIIQVYIYIFLEEYTSILLSWCLWK